MHHGKSRGKVFAGTYGEVHNFPYTALRFVTRCQLLRLKCTKFDFGWDSAPDPAGGANSTPPDPSLDLKGPTFKGRQERGWEWEEGRRKGGQGEGDLLQGLRGIDAPDS